MLQLTARIDREENRVIPLCILYQDKSKWEDAYEARKEDHLIKQPSTGHIRMTYSIKSYIGSKSCLHEILLLKICLQLKDAYSSIFNKRNTGYHYHKSQIILSWRQGYTIAMPQDNEPWLHIYIYILIFFWVNSQENQMLFSSFGLRKQRKLCSHHISCRA